MLKVFGLWLVWTASFCLLAAQQNDQAAATAARQDALGKQHECGTTRDFANNKKGSCLDMKDSVDALKVTHYAGLTGQERQTFDARYGSGLAYHNQAAGYYNTAEKRVKDEAEPALFQADGNYAAGNWFWAGYYYQIAANGFTASRNGFENAMSQWGSGRNDFLACYDLLARQD